MKPGEIIIIDTDVWTEHRPGWGKFYSSREEKATVITYSKDKDEYLVRVDSGTPNDLRWIRSERIRR